MGHEKIPTDSEKLFPLRDLNRVLLRLEANALATRPLSSPKKIIRTRNEILTLTHRTNILLLLVLHLLAAGSADAHTGPVKPLLALVAADHEPTNTTTDLICACTSKLLSNMTKLNS
jgi:hypothetical protein